MKEIQFKEEVVNYIGLNTFVEAGSFEMPGGGSVPAVVLGMAVLDNEDADRIIHFVNIGLSVETALSLMDQLVDFFLQQQQEKESMIEEVK